MKPNINYNARSAESQCAQIAAWLERGLTITPLEAVKLFGCLRLSGRIFELKERGYNIVAEKVLRNEKWVAEYHLAK